jgi:ribose 5-phosphate isomerase B
MWAAPRERDPIVMAGDHRGVHLKAALREKLEAAGHPVIDKGTNGDSAVDYPDFAAAAARVVSTGEVPRGILICGSAAFPACAPPGCRTRRWRASPGSTTTPT